MKAILKCIYIVLFLILIASSSALFILVASESMQNFHTISNSENKHKNLNIEENFLHENVESESVSCDKEDLKNSKNFKTNSNENFDSLNCNIEKIGETKLLEPDKSMNSPEILSDEEVVEINKINESYLTDLGLNNNSNVNLDNNTNNNHIKEIVSCQSPEKKLNVFENIDETHNEPVISRDIPPDKIEQRIIDSGGSDELSNAINEDRLVSSQETISLSDIHDAKKSEQNLETNITEEKPIPVFSEWAQIQMEEAEKKLEKDVVNVSSMKKNITNGSKPAPNLMKLRVKNYASPDCGAKIITSNSEAQNTGALLTSSKDEYMLSPCTSRIWFVVELCEAIQAKQIDFANFELFSSSPKNFTVAVSNRFPTRDWLNVGRFIADDTRNIQSFDLFPHLFGKYIRVDVHSHYNSEHFCPISLLRVYGTSEFEAFDSENRNPYEDIDDVDDDIVQIEPNKSEDNNLFKSASDAVMSIVKKAAQVLSKDKSNRIEFRENNSILCSTPTFNNFDCSNCSQITIDNVNYLLSCRYKDLIQLLKIKILLGHLIRSELCFNRFNIDIAPTRKLFFLNLSKNISILSEIDKSLSLNYKQKQKNHNLKFNNQSYYSLYENELVIDEKQSYYLSSINLDYLGAMCHILKHQNLFDSYSDETLLDYVKDDTSLNLIVEKLQNTNDPLSNEKTNEEFNLDYNNDKKINEKVSIIIENNINAENSIETKTNEIVYSTKEDIYQNDIVSDASSTTEDILNTEKSIQTIDEGINIFNIVDDSGAAEDNGENFSEDISKEKYSSNDQKIIYKSEESFENTAPIPPIISNKIREEDSQWETDEKLFNEQLSSDVNLSGNQPGFNLNNGGTNQHKSGQHSESVFTRLSNRIKALERNMSLSGQYLEELSRRYKKQVEELQISFTKTLTAIEDQNRRFIELETKFHKRNALLQSNLDELNVKLHFWMFVLIVVTAVGLIYILTSFYSVTIIRRRQKSLFKKFEETTVHRKDNEKLKRRKSTDGVSKNSNSNKKIRRPSEEAMKINGSYKDLMIHDDDDDDDDDSIENLNSCEEYGNHSENSETSKKSNLRNRKISICYSKDNLPIIKKHSITNISKQDNNCNRDLNRCSNKTFLNSSSKCCNKDCEYYVDGQDNETIPEEIIVVDDESDQFISGGDSAYEYIAQKSSNGDNMKNDDKQKKGNNINNNKSIKPKKSEGLRRLSSPSFLKSPFNKKTTTESTGWEWIRNGSNKNRQKNVDNLSNKEYFKLINNSLDSDKNVFIERNPSPNSTVSEQIIFHNSINNSENDSLRTTNSDSSSLQASTEGASLPIQLIGTASTSIATSSTTTTTNAKEINGISNGNNKNKTKKQRSFKKMFKKVF